MVRASFRTVVASPSLSYRSSLHVSHIGHIIRTMDTGAQTQQMKTCTKCGATKPSSGFGKYIASKDGLRPWCRECWNAYKRGQYHTDANWKEYCATYKRGRRMDPDYLMADQMRQMVRRTLTSQKPASSQNILGYSAKELRAHLESQFEPGMTWDDRGAWHIDHVKPVSAFIAEGVKDPQIINALSNLKPLWAKDNLAKGARY